MTTTEERAATVPWPSTEDSPSSIEYQDPLRVDTAEPSFAGATSKQNQSNRSILLAERRLNAWNLVALSISMLGVQMSWTIELALV